MDRGILNIPDPFYIRRHDTMPAYQVDVYDENGDPVDLSGATATLFSMRGPGSDITRKVDGAAGSVEVGPDGSTVNRMKYQWVAADTDVSGEYSAQFELSWAGGNKRTFPPVKSQALKIVISDDWEDS